MTKIDSHYLLALPCLPFALSVLLLVFNPVSVSRHSGESHEIRVCDAHD